jgi:hypothetical protein
MMDTIRGNVVYVEYREISELPNEVNEKYERNEPPEGELAKVIQAMKQYLYRSKGRLCIEKMIAVQRGESYMHGYK